MDETFFKEEFQKINQRFDGIDSRLEGMDSRFDRIDGRLDKVEARMHDVEEHVLTAMQGMSDQMAELRVTLDRIDRRDNEDIRALYSEIDKIKTHVGMETASA